MFFSPKLNLQGALNTSLTESAVTDLTSYFSSLSPFTETVVIAGCVCSSLDKKDTRSACRYTPVCFL